MKLRRSTWLSHDPKPGFTICSVAFGLFLNCPEIEFVPPLSFPLSAIICRAFSEDLLQAVVYSHIYAVD